jgi:radical SAM protein with 4Fe4S-binding SPASM domain
MRQVVAGVDMLRRPNIVPNMPYYLVLGTTTACPLNCVMCSRDSVISQAKRMAFSDYQKLIDTIQPLQVSVGDLGESLFDSDLDKKIRYAKEKSAVVDVVTSYAISRIPADVLIEAGLDVLKVSIDGATAETYEAIRGEPYFEQALQHTRALIELRKRLGRQTPYVYLQFVLQNQSYEEMIEYVRLAAEIGADRIDYKPLIMDVERTGRDQLVGDMTADRTYTLLQEADQLAISLGLRTNAPVLTPAALQRHWAIYYGEDSRPQDLKRCMLPWYSTYVAADGNVYGCCILRFQDAGILGNIHETDFVSIWNSEAYQRFRRKMRKGDSPFGACYACYPQSLTDTFKYLATTPKLRLLSSRRRQDGTARS